MICRICQKNATDNTSGICVYCLTHRFIRKGDMSEGQFLNYTANKLRKFKGLNVIVWDKKFILKRKLKFLCGLFWKHERIYDKKLQNFLCAICNKSLSNN